jgi:hypothetical protein
MELTPLNIPESVPLWLVGWIKEVEERLNKLESKGSSRMTRPTEQEVYEYGVSIDYPLDAESFISFYESKGWMIGKNPMKNWKSAIVTWKKKGIGKVEYKYKKDGVEKSVSKERYDQFKSEGKVREINGELIWVG